MNTTLYIYIYIYILFIITKGAEWSQALRLLGELQEARLQPNVITFSAGHDTIRVYTYIYIYIYI